MNTEASAAAQERSQLQKELKAAHDDIATASLGAPRCLLLPPRRRSLPACEGSQEHASFAPRLAFQSLTYYPFWPLPLPFSQLQEEQKGLRREVESARQAARLCSDQNRGYADQVTQLQTKASLRQGRAAIVARKLAPPLLRMPCWPHRCCVCPAVPTAAACAQLAHAVGEQEMP